MLTSVFLNVLELSVSTAAIMLIAAVIQLFLKGKIKAKTRYLIWLLILIRLTIPISGEFTVLQYSINEHLPENTVESASNDNAEDNHKDYVSSPNKENVSYTIPDENNANNTKESQRFDTARIISILAKAWAVIAALILVFRLLSYLVFSLEQKRNRVPYDKEELQKLTCLQTGKKAIPVYISKKVKTPLLYGFLAPKILLPRPISDIDILSYIIMHEQIHKKRFDLWVKFLENIILSIYWFNPFAYFLASQINLTMELSCDEAVLKGKTKEEHNFYGRIMLDIMKSRITASRVTPMTTCFTPKFNQIKERFSEILNTRKKRNGFIAVAIVALLCTCAGILIAFRIVKTHTPEAGTIIKDEPNKVIDKISEPVIQAQTETEKTTWEAPYIPPVLTVEEKISSYTVYRLENHDNALVDFIVDFVYRSDIISQNSEFVIAFDDLPDFALLASGNRCKKIFYNTGEYECDIPMSYSFEVIKADDILAVGSCYYSGSYYLLNEYDCTFIGPDYDTPPNGRFDVPVTYNIYLGEDGKLRFYSYYIGMLCAITQDCSLFFFINNEYDLDRNFKGEGYIDYRNGSFNIHEEYIGSFRDIYGEEYLNDTFDSYISYSPFLTKEYNNYHEYLTDKEAGLLPDNEYYEK